MKTYILYHTESKDWLNLQRRGRWSFVCEVFRWDLARLQYQVALTKPPMTTQLGQTRSLHTHRTKRAGPSRRKTILYTMILGGLLASYINYAKAEVVYLPVITSLEHLSPTETESKYEEMRIDVPSTVLDDPSNDSIIRVTYVDKGGPEGSYRGRVAEPAGSYSWFPRRNAGETMRHYLQRLHDDGQLRGTVVLKWSVVTYADVCQGFVIDGNKLVMEVYDTDKQAAYAKAKQGVRFDWQPTCSELPPVAQACEILESSVTLDFKTLPIQYARGATKSAALTVRCTDATKIQLSNAMNGNILLSNSGQVALTTNGYPISPSSLTYSVGAGESKAIPITAEIITAGNAGSFTGQAVISLRYP